MNSQELLGAIEVPKYVSNVFSRKLSREEAAMPSIQQATARTHYLIAEALKDLPYADWEIPNTKYRSPAVSEPFGIEDKNSMTFIYAEQRGEKYPIAIFKDAIAADYFVWLVSKGERKIDWAQGL